MNGVSSEVVRAASAGNSVTGFAGDGSTAGETSFAAGCSVGGIAEESTRSDSEVSFERAITGSWADMGRKSGVGERVGWAKVSWTEGRVRS